MFQGSSFQGGSICIQLHSRHCKFQLGNSELQGCLGLDNTFLRDKVCKNYLLHQRRMFQAGMNRRLVILLLGCYRVVLAGRGFLL